MSTNGARVSVLLTVSDETCNQKFYVCGYTFFSPPEHKHVDAAGDKVHTAYCKAVYCTKGNAEKHI